MRTLLCVVVALAACGKSDDDLKAEIAKQQARHGDESEATAVETKKVETPAEPKKTEETIAEPDPSNPEDVHRARKEAMMLKRYADVVRFCEMGKIDEKSDQQARFGCALAACNLKEADKARMWAKGIERALLEQAIKVCTPAGVTL